jgi:hypothetical protein
MSTLDLTKAISELSVDEPKKKVLLYSLVLNQEAVSILMNLPPVKEHHASYNIKEELHSTLIFAKGKPQEQIDIVGSVLGETYYIEVYNLAVSDRYMTLGVGGIKSWALEDIPYFGNEFKHLTLGFSNDTKFKPKDLTPVNSPSAFSDGRVIEFPFPFWLPGTVTVQYAGVKGKK